MSNQNELKNSEKDHLSPRQRRAIPFLLNARSLEEGRKAAGISKYCLFKWLKQEAFKKELEKQREEIIQQALQKLKSNICEAIDILLSLMRSAKSEGVKLNAAREVLAFFLKARELEELSSRLMQIEKIVWERKFFG